MSNQTNLIRDLQMQSFLYSTIIEKLTQQHKDYKLFKQLIKRQSKALESYNNEMIQISRQFNSDLFNGIHYHMSHFQSDLQNQYALLKELGKHFYEIKQEAQYYSKNYTKFESKLNSTSNAFDENSLKLKQTLQETTNFWAQKQEYSVIRINDMSNKGEEIIKKTNSLIYKFSEKHLFFIDNYKTCSGRKSRNSSCNRTSSSMQSALKSKETTNIYQDKSIDQTNCFQVGQSIQDFESDFNRALAQKYLVEIYYKHIFYLEKGNLFIFQIPNFEKYNQILLELHKIINTYKLNAHIVKFIFQAPYFEYYRKRIKLTRRETQLKKMDLNFIRNFTYIYQIQFYTVQNFQIQKNDYFQNSYNL